MRPPLEIAGVRLTPRVLERALVEARSRYELYGKLVALMDTDKLNYPKVHELMKEGLEHYTYLQIGLALRLDHMLKEMEGNV